jgi:hypothetical protein
MFVQTFAFMGAKWDVPDCAWVSSIHTFSEAKSIEFEARVLQDGKSCITPIVPKTQAKAQVPMVKCIADADFLAGYF